MKDKIIKAIIVSLFLSLDASNAHRLHSHTHLKGYTINAPV